MKREIKGKKTRTYVMRQELKMNVEYDNIHENNNEKDDNKDEEQMEEDEEVNEIEKVRTRRFAPPSCPHTSN